MLDLRFGHHIGVTLSEKKNYEAQLLNNLILKGEIEKNIFFLKKDLSQHVLNLLTHRPLIHD